MAETQHRAFAPLLAAALLLGVAACGDSSPPSTCEGDACDETDGGLGDTPGSDVDVESDTDEVDVSDDADAAPADTEPDGDATIDPVEDVASEPDADIVYPPLEWTTSPEHGETFVELDVVIEVAFNQPMNGRRFIPSNVTLTEFEAGEVPRSLHYDGDEQTLRVSPDPADALLRPVTPYEFRLNDVIASVSGEELGEDLIVEFSTTGYPGRGFHRQLAEAYAPVVYQQVEELDIDTFARIDFDGDLSPANNLESVAGANYGFAYYDLVESVTHYFLTYFYYYPASHPREDVTFEHDFVAAQLVVQKDPEDPLGRLRAFSTFYHEDMNAWLLDGSHYPDGEAVSEGDEGLGGRLAPEWLVDDRQPSLLIESGRHAVCLPNASARSCGAAGGADAPFEDGTIGLVYRVAEDSLRYGDAEDSELTYSLRNFVEEFWALRNRTTGDDAVFGGGFDYRPPPISDDDFRPGEGEVFPTALNSDHDEGSFGDLPFIYNATGHREDQGVWFADPAWGALSLFEFTESFSIEYCFNPYLDIDLRDLRDGCTPTTFLITDE